jgi:hypothetical protein
MLDARYVCGPAGVAGVTVAGVIVVAPHPAIDNAAIRAAENAPALRMDCR